MLDFLAKNLNFTSAKMLFTVYVLNAEDVYSLKK